jgi:cytochrome o ubiquinol oxidase subunit II
MMRGNKQIQSGWLLCVAALFLSGCNMALLDPKGQIGLEQRSLIITAIALMLIVVVPVIAMTFWFAWRYRASNTKATYTPNWEHSNKIEFVVWTIPCIIILILGTITWRSTHELDPRKPIASSAKPLVIEAISLDWKWLFIYPEQGVATINQIAFPVNVPVQFKVTSGSVMNSFFIPQLGSQIYAMAGMRNQVHLIANEEGNYQGISANYSGHGFSGMKFVAEVTSQQGFEQWLAQAKASPSSLQFADYQQLVKPSQNNPVAYYSSVEANLYDRIVNQFMGHGLPGGAPHQMVEMSQAEAMPMDHMDTEHMEVHSGNGE